MTTSNEKTFSSLIHLSSLLQYFIPFGNFIFPIVLWSTKKNDSEFVDYNGKQTLNFQLSILLYSLILLIISIPILLFTVLKNFTVIELLKNHDIWIHEWNFNNFSGIVIIAILGCVLIALLKVLEFALIIYAAVKASNGEKYHYPLSISFFK